jgi:hypothetical protein
MAAHNDMGKPDVNITYEDVKRAAGNDHVKWLHRDHQSWPHPDRCDGRLMGC